MSDIKNILEAASNSEPANFNKLLAEEISSRLLEAIDYRKTEIISEMFGIDEGFKSEVGHGARIYRRTDAVKGAVGGALYGAAKGYMNSGSATGAATSALKHGALGAAAGYGVGATRGAAAGAISHGVGKALKKKTPIKEETFEMTDDELLESINSMSAEELDSLIEDIDYIEEEVAKSRTVGQEVDHGARIARRSSAVTTALAGGVGGYKAARAAGIGRLGSAAAGAAGAAAGGAIGAAAGHFSGARKGVASHAMGKVLGTDSRIRARELAKNTRRKR